MKKIMKPMLIASLFLLLLTACNTEDLFIAETIIEEVVDEIPTDIEDIDTTADSNIPCEFDLSTVSDGDTVIIDCMMDLNGQTFDLPSNVNILFAGGDIINGTLNFSDNVVISGELLNSSLILSGSTPQLKDSTFNLDPERWDIVEGKVDDEVALSNKNILQNLVNQTKSMGVSTFSIDNMDAYFKVGAYGSPKQVSAGGLEIPSNFHLKMTDNTYLRVQPNNMFYNYFISVFLEENVTITGGNLIGDRWDHIYDNNNNYISHEWPVLLVVSGGVNVLIDGVYMTDSTGDAFVSGSTGTHRYLENATFTKNLIVRNCTMNESRRNNISITDGQDILIENCTISDAGVGQQPKDASGATTQYTSAGVLPKAGIDIEPFLGQDAYGDLVFYERVERVTIRGCSFTGNVTSSFINYTGEDVTIEDCVSDNSFSAHYGWDTKFFNNTLEPSILNENKVGITTGYSTNYEANGNHISGFRVGIELYGDMGLIANNIIKDCSTGIQPKAANNFIIENNDFQGCSILCFQSEGNLIFRNNTIMTLRYPLSVIRSNTSQKAIDANYSIVFENNHFSAEEEGYWMLFDGTTSTTTVKNNTISNSKFLIQNGAITEANNIFN